MALLQNVKLNIGIEINGAYIRIDTINGNKERLEISVNTYVSKNSFLNGSGYLEQKTYAFKPLLELDSDNFIKQGYGYLKTLPEFANALNVPSDGGPD